MKKAIIIIGLLLVLAGCGGNKIKINTIKNDLSADGARIRTETPEIAGSSEFIKNINSELAEGIRGETVRFQENAAASDTADDELEITYAVAFAENGMVSLIVDGEAFTGGVHGELMRKSKTFDIETEREITFVDLFCDDQFPTRINSYIEQLMEENPNKYADLWKRPLVGTEQEFYLTDTGVVIYFPPYALSYYSRGFVEFEIPYEELDGYLNPEYNGRLWNR